MEFCPKCGAIIMGVNCARCDYKSDKEVKLESSQKMAPKKEVVCVDEDVGEIKPIVTMACKKCAHPEAYFWTQQTRASDESETKFYKCTKCKHTWRDYR